MKMLLIVISTYNEIENLPSLLAEVWRVLPAAEVIVIDDDSPDGTGEWSLAESRSERRLQVVIRKGERGLGSATLLGLRQACDRGFEFAATIDADGSHDPQTLGAMILDFQKPRNNAVGLMIGSRYTSGGSIVGWPWLRRFVSRALNIWVRCCLNLPTRDNSGAFRIYRTAALREVDLNSIRSSGYAYLEEILFRFKQKGIKTLEFPITFRDRIAGRSKANIGEAWGVFWRVIRLRLFG